MWVSDYEKFAFVLRDALKKKQVVLSRKIKYEYEPLWAIRAVEREEKDYRELSEADFYSQEEKDYYGGKKRPRGVSYAFSGDIGKYSCSFFKTKWSIANALRLPQKGRKLAIGILINSYGGILHKESKPHIHLFRYDNVVPAFEIIDYNKLKDK